MPLVGSAQVESAQIVSRCEAPRERVEQVCERGRIKAPDVNHRERAGQKRVAHRAHARQIAQPAYACEVRAPVEQVVQVKVREPRHVRSERRAREVLAVRGSGHAVPGCEAKSHVLADGADPPACDELSRRIRRRARREHALAVIVVVRPEPRALAVVRVGQDPACTRSRRSRSKARSRPSRPSVDCSC